MLPRFVNLDGSIALRMETRRYLLIISYHIVYIGTTIWYYINLDQIISLVYTHIYLFK